MQKRKDARLFDPPSYEDKPVCPARKGTRQPWLSARIANPVTHWLQAVQSSRTSWRSNGWIEYAHGTALWHYGGKSIVPILWVLGRYPNGRCKPEAFLCTDTGALPRRAAWYLKLPGGSSLTFPLRKTPSNMRRAKYDANACPASYPPFVERRMPLSGNTNELMLQKWI